MRFEDSVRVTHDQMSLIIVANAIDGLVRVKLDHGDMIVCYSNKSGQCTAPRCNAAIGRASVSDNLRYCY